jgi:hypothetical protein
MTSSLDMPPSHTLSSVFVVGPFQTSVFRDSSCGPGSRAAMAA